MRYITALAIVGFALCAQVSAGQDARSESPSEARALELAKHKRDLESRAPLKAVAVTMMDQHKLSGSQDGDSFYVICADSSAVHIRIQGVDAPERSQAFGFEAAKLTAKLLQDKEVWIVPIEIGKFGRTIARVICPDGRTLGEHLLWSGMAWYSHKYDHANVSYHQLEEIARSSQTGLWSEKSPKEPWQYRREVFDSGEWVVRNDSLFMATPNGQLVLESEYFQAAGLLVLD